MTWRVVEFWDRENGGPLAPSSYHIMDERCVLLARTHFPDMELARLLASSSRMRHYLQRIASMDAGPLVNYLVEQALTSDPERCEPLTMEVSHATH